MIGLDTLFRPQHHARRELLFIVGLAGGLMLLMAVTVQFGPTELDRSLAKTVQGVDWGALQSVPKFASDLGGGVYGFYAVPAAAGLALAATRKWKMLALVAVVFLLHYLLISPKLIVTANRPSPAFGVEGAGGLESFPSGHVQWAVSFYGLLTYFALQKLKGWRAAAVSAGFAAIVVGTMLGRVDLGRHWPSDTIAGAIAGLIALRMLILLDVWRIWLPRGGRLGGGRLGAGRAATAPGNARMPSTNHAREG